MPTKKLRKIIGEQEQSFTEHMSMSAILFKPKKEVCDICGLKVEKPNYISKITGEGYRYCRNCYTPGFKIEGLLTRTSKRVQEQQQKHAADFVQPHSYDKNRKKLVPNPDFIKLYPDQMHHYFNKEELRKEGYGKLGEHMEKTQATKKAQVAAQKKAIQETVQHAGSQKKGTKKLIKNL